LKGTLAFGRVVGSLSVFALCILNGTHLSTFIPESKFSSALAVAQAATCLSF
jgi:hypothetical protein